MWNEGEKDRGRRRESRVMVPDGLSERRENTKRGKMRDMEGRALRERGDGEMVKRI